MREAIVAVPALAGASHGDATLFMWCDSDAYLLWGREVFGWPLARGAIRLEGTLWADELSEGVHGDCELRTHGGGVAVLGVQVGRALEGGVPARGWVSGGLLCLHGWLCFRQKALLCGQFSRSRACRHATREATALGLGDRGSR